MSLVGPSAPADGIVDYEQFTGLFDTFSKCTPIYAFPDNTAPFDQYLHARKFVIQNPADSLHMVVIEPTRVEVKTGRQETVTRFVNDCNETELYIYTENKSLRAPLRSSPACRVRTRDNWQGWMNVYGIVDLGGLVSDLVGKIRTKLPSHDWLTWGIRFVDDSVIERDRVIRRLADPISEQYTVSDDGDDVVVAVSYIFPSMGETYVKCSATIRGIRLGLSNSIKPKVNGVTLEF